MQRYSEIIIEHSQFPRHHGSIDKPTHQGRGENPFCGDRVTLQMVVSAEGVAAPKQVRMGWNETQVPNLADKNGWPVFQFPAQQVK